jgi:hypothetical protein
LGIRGKAVVGGKIEICVLTSSGGFFSPDSEVAAARARCQTFKAVGFKEVGFLAKV